MARPKKHPAETRSKRFNLRFTVAERAHVDTQAQLAGLDTHEYLRRRALDYEVPSGASRRADPGLVTEVNRLGVQLVAIGNNANQLARAANAGRPERIAWQDVVKRINELGAQVTAALERLVLD